VDKSNREFGIKACRIIHLDGADIEIMHIINAIAAAMLGGAAKRDDLSRLAILF
jgi:hypothetical protein